MKEEIKLSDQQEAIIDFVTKKTGHAIVRARAGCGKSFSIIESTAAIVENDWTANIFIGAFNKAIADEMKEKCEEKNLRFPEVNVSTMHSAGFSALKKLHGRMRVEDKKVGYLFFEWVDQFSQAKQERMKEYRSFFLRTVGLAKQNGFGVQMRGDRHLLIDDHMEWKAMIDHFGLEENLPEDNTMDLSELIDQCIRFYRRSLEDCEHTIDFNDMILAPLYFNAPFDKKDFVFIDEAQDTNAVRRELAFRMLKPNGRLIAVGDDRQAIYGFTGADSDALDIIMDITKAVILPLTTTYRCGKAIITEAQKYVPDIEAFEKNSDGLVRATTMDDFLEKEVPTLTPQDVILCRLNKPLVQLAFKMIKSGKGCYIEGRDVGNGLIELAKKWKRITSVPQLIERLTTYEASERSKWLAKGRPEMAQMIEDKVECLFIISEQVSNGNVDDLVREITKLFGDTKKGERPRVVTLSSIHKSKGREWDRVYSLGFHQLLPSVFAVKEWQIRQEENLAYVNITRAKKELIYVEFVKEY